MARPPVPITPIRTRSLAPQTWAKEPAERADKPTSPAPVIAEPWSKLRRVARSWSTFMFTLPSGGAPLQYTRAGSAGVRAPAESAQAARAEPQGLTPAISEKEPEG